MRERRLSSTIVGVGKNPDEPQAIRQALSYLPIENFINNNDVVVITANMVNMNPPEKGVVVGPNSLKELIKIIKEKKPKKIVIAAGSGGANTEEVLHNFGFDKIVQEEAVEFIDLNKGPFVDLEINSKLIKSTKVRHVAI